MSGRGKFAERRSLIAASLDHVRNVHLLGVAIHERAIFAGDEGQDKSGATRQTRHP